jgi:hypothetical protein
VCRADSLLLDGAREDLILNTGLPSGGVEKKGGSEVGGSFNQQMADADRLNRWSRNSREDGYAVAAAATRWGEGAPKLNFQRLRIAARGDAAQDVSAVYLLPREQGPKPVL